MSVGPVKGHVFEGHASFSDGCALPIHGWSPDTYKVSFLLGCGVGVRTAGLSVLDPDYNPAPSPDTLDRIPRKTPGQGILNSQCNFEKGDESKSW